MENETNIKEVLVANIIDICKESKLSTKDNEYREAIKSIASGNGITGDVLVRAGDKFRIVGRNLVITAHEKGLF